MNQFFAHVVELREEKYKGTSKNSIGERAMREFFVR